MPPNSIIELRAQILANCKFLFPGRQLEVITGAAPVGSGTAYVVDLNRKLIGKQAVKPGVLLTAKTESETLGDGLIQMLGMTKKMVAEKIAGKVPSMPASD